MVSDDARRGARPAHHDRRELFEAGARSDDVELREYGDRWPVPGTRAERRARRHVLSWWVLSCVAGLAAIAVYVFWPWRYVAPGEPGYTAYELATPLLGLCLGVALLSFAFGFVVLVKRFFPQETAIQQRHDAEGSSVTDRATLVATVAEAAHSSRLRRRSVFTRTAGVSASVLGGALGAVAIGGFAKDPWSASSPGDRKQDTLWHTGWTPRGDETVYLRAAAGDPHEVTLVRPEDLDPSAAMAVVPFRESERGDREALSKAMHRADNPVTLLRLPAGTAVRPKEGRKGMNFGDYFAYSRICTHLGCPVSMYEATEDRLLCPCHQSLFDLREHAKPIFGPAVRALPQLPIAVDDEGFFVATAGLTDAVGPSFWELPP